MEDGRETLGIIGGTGPQGRGLGARWARAGHPVVIGSRSLERAEDAAADVRARAGEGAAAVSGGTNEDVAADGDIIVVTVPYEAQPKALPSLREAIGDKIVVNCVNPMVFDAVGPQAVRVEAGSAAEECQELLPEARVVSSFHDVSSRRLLEVDEPVSTHVLICGDDDDANRAVADLAALIEGMQGVFCGPLRISEYIENLTPVILSVNKIYGIEAGIFIDGVEGAGG